MLFGFGVKRVLPLEKGAKRKAKSPSTGGGVRRAFSGSSEERDHSLLVQVLLKSNVNKLLSTGKGKKVLNHTVGRIERELDQQQRGLDSTTGAVIYQICHLTQDA